MSDLSPARASGPPTPEPSARALPASLRRNAPLVPVDSAGGRALAAVIAILTFLAALCAGGAELVASHSAQWRSAVGREATVQVRQRPQRDIEADLLRVADLSRRTPGIRAAEIPSRTDAERTLEPWLLAIARFKALSALRGRKEAELDDEMAEAVEDTSDDPEVAMQKKDTGEILRKCLTKLSAEHKEIIDLVYYHEKSVEEVAEIVGIPENTVKTRLFYARKKLAELLKAAGVERGWP